MIQQEEIARVLKLIQKAVKQFEEPAVTQISRVTKQDPYRVLMSCLLSLRTRDETTAKASARLFSLADTPKKMVRLTRKQIEKAIYPVGFYHVKAKRILEVSKTLLDQYNGNVPRTMEELLKLKGVGRKTANIVLTYAFQDHDGLAVDVHCHRIPNRLGWVKTKTPEQTETALRMLVPRKYWILINDTFVTFGICYEEACFLMMSIISRKDSGRFFSCFSSVFLTLTTSISFAFFCFCWNFSTLPSVSMYFISPVKNGWHLLQISTWISCIVEPTLKVLPQTQITLASSKYCG